MMKLLLIVLVSMMLLAVGCGSTPEEVEEPAIDLPNLSTQQVINIIQDQGVPNTIDYLEEDWQKKVQEDNPSWLGDWDAVYEGECKWRIEGKILLKYDGNYYLCSTVWRYIEDTEYINLIYFHPGEQAYHY